MLTRIELNIDKNQYEQARKESQAATLVVPRAARECFKWLLCPVQDDPTATKPTIEPFPLNTTSGSPGAELARVCRENELVIEVWSPIHLRTKLKELYWKADKSAVSAMAFWEDSQRYLYLPRLKSRDVLASVVRNGAASQDFFGTAYGQTDGKFDGFQFGSGTVSFDDTLLLIEPEAAKQYAGEQKNRKVVAPPGSGKIGIVGTEADDTAVLVEPGKKPGSGSTPPAKAKSFHGSVEVNATLAKSRLNTIADEVIALLASDPDAAIRITLEIDAEFANGASDTIKRGVSENATSLGFKTKDWE